MLIIKKKLLAPAEIHFSNQIVGGTDEIIQTEFQDEPSTSTLVQNLSDQSSKWLKTRMEKKETGLTSSWVEGDFENSESTEFPLPDYEAYKNKTPTEVFEKFFDEKVWEHLREESQKYSVKKCN